MSSLYRMSPFITIKREESGFTLVFWGASQEPLVYSIDDPEHPIYHIIETNTVTFTPFPEQYADDFATLVEEGVIVPQDWDRQAEIDNYIERIHDPKHLHLILLPAGTACNCNCLYCGQDHDGKGMSWEHEGQAILRFIRNRPPETLHVEFFGGEPLCALPFIEQVCSDILNICQSTGMRFHGSMTTNGTLLTPEVFGKLLRNQITEYQITIDGTEEHHNRLRPMRNGNNSYQELIRNLKQIKETAGDYSVTLRMNFDTLSAETGSVSNHLAELNDWIQNDYRFKLRFRPACDWGGDIETKTLCSKMQATELTSKLSKTAAIMGFCMADISMWAVGGHACYAGRGNSFVIEPGLRVKKCTVTDISINNVGRISEDGQFIKNENWKLWVDAIAPKNNCIDCSWQPTCLQIGCKLALHQKSNAECLKSTRALNEVSSFVMAAI